MGPMTGSPLAGELRFLIPPDSDARTLEALSLWSLSRTGIQAISLNPELGFRLSQSTLHAVVHRYTCPKELAYETRGSHEATTLLLFPRPAMFPFPGEHPNLKHHNLQVTRNHLSNHPHAQRDDSSTSKQPPVQGWKEPFFGASSHRFID